MGTSMFVVKPEATPFDAAALACQIAEMLLCHSDISEGHGPRMLKDLSGAERHRYMAAAEMAVQLTNPDRHDIALMAAADELCQQRLCDMTIFELPRRLQAEYLEQATEVVLAYTGSLRLLTVDPEGDAAYARLMDDVQPKGTK